MFFLHAKCSTTSFPLNGVDMDQVGVWSEGTSCIVRLGVGFLPVTSIGGSPHGVNIELPAPCDLKNKNSDMNLNI